MRFVPALVLLGVLSTACGDPKLKPDGSVIDAELDGASLDAPIDGNPLMPATLFDTGLCVDKACSQIASGIYTYTPQFTLWADTASKRRWMYLPPGTKIDTSDMDHWVFPQGTKFWKEFTRNSTRVETRLIYKIGPGNDVSDWFYVAYQWNATQDDTMAVPLGQVDANGTQHDIPPRSACRTCHENVQPSRILGFSALSLDFDGAAGEIDLDDAVANNWLTNAPGGAASPHFPLPGAATVRTALGYMHANCGHCHNPTSKVYTNNGITMFLRLDTTTLGSPATTPPYMTAVGQNAVQPIDGLDKIVIAMDPDHSILIDRFESTNPSVHMPALGSEMTDPTGAAALRAWINALPP